MVKLTKIYTRTGDAGTTALGNGKRVDKHDLRVEAYGTVDELNAFIGVARLHCVGESDRMLGRVQNDLFDLGADLCVPATADEKPGSALRVNAQQVSRLETEIDCMNASLSPLNSFILPGGSAASAHLHVARTVARRAERLVSALGGQENVGSDARTYLNRLSDHLFVLARWNNEQGACDILWVPGANRQD